MLLDNIWIINLDKSKDRLERINKNFNYYGIKYNRFSAIYGKNVSDEYLKENVTDICKYFLCNYGIIGCAASHKTLWKQLLNSESEMYLILEDDIEINSKTIEMLKIIEPFIKKYDIEYLNLNCLNTGCNLQNVEFTIDEYKFGKPYTPFQTNSYIITKKGADKLLKYISKTNYHVDFEILFIKLFQNLKYYSVTPSLIDLTGEETTIGNNTKTIISRILNFLNLEYLGWFLNVPILTINMIYEINFLIIFLIILLLTNILYIKSSILLLFIILEITILNLKYL